MVIKTKLTSGSIPWKKWNGKYFRYVPPIFITILLLVGYFTFGMLDSFSNVVAAIGASILTEIILARCLLKSWKNLSSAYISGISVGILIRSTMIWPYLITAAISIMTKYVLRYKGRHLWNPSNFGVSWMLFIAPFSVAGLSIQWGNNLLGLVVIWLMGLIIIWRAKRLHITLTYVLSFVFFAWLRSLISDDNFLTELAPLTGPMYQLFIFFMITDPATGVRGKKGQVLVAFLVALVEFVLRMNHFIYAPFYALFMVGPVAKYIDLRRGSIQWAMKKSKVKDA